MTDIINTSNNFATKENFDLAIQVSDRVAIEDVRLIDLTCNQHPREAGQDNTFRISHDVDVKVDSEASYLFVIAHFTFKGYASKDESQKPFVKIEASFLLAYKVDDFEGLTQDNFREFANLNGLYNAWPYWRELLQNTLTRMALPHLTIPVFRLLKPKPKEESRKQVVTEQETEAD